MINSTDCPEYKYRVMWWKEINGYNDSDWYADVVNNDGSIDSILFQTTRCGMYGKAEIDLIPYLAVKVFHKKVESNIAYLNAKNIEHSKAVCKARVVEVFKGRKVPRGTTGKIFYMKENEYGSVTLGLIDENGIKHWTYADNVKVVNPEQYLAPDYRIYTQALKLSFREMPKYTQTYIMSFLRGIL